ncbi:amidohydrolase [Rhodocaloribacter litoris]|uniref:amidohydrolase n=1 Tax=Rhodocaloribacter litoris TaxID=2558931 RepID=UPI001421A200|nr:amidohydrolase [Rhodocaloribacter litoris]QXD14709.1 amidohydrolase [Rhodocaloribacter litoris]GIV59200.1 MAG: N-acyl-L-amino acid amidohydrolase [Rhodothermaceae bacterium]
MSEEPILPAAITRVLREDTPPEIRQDLPTLLTAIRHHLHMNPELGLQEFETARFIREVLEMHGLVPEGPVAVTGLYVDIKGAHPGPAVGFRADMDALPIQDGKQVPYASQRPGVAHLCGHDVHTTVGLGVALLLARLRDRLHGTVRVFFQPNEEGIPSGAPLMMREGVLDGLEAVYAIHVDPTLPVGVYGLITGPATASADRFRVLVQGPSTGHSARPHQSVDTIWVATQIMNTFYQLVGRVTDARNDAVLAITRIHGGEADNVIPDRVAFGGTLRCTVREDRDLLKAYLSRAASEIGALHRARIEVDIDDGAPAVVNDPRLIDNVRRTILEADGPSAIFEIPRPSLGAEDFAYYLEAVPGALIRVGTSSGPATSHPLHDACFDVDERALAPTARLMAHVLVNHLRNRPLG